MKTKQPNRQPKKQPAKKKVPQVQKPPKEPKMKSSAPRRFGAWVLVAFMLSTMAFGVYKIMRAPTEASIEHTIQNSLEDIDDDTVARTKVVAFAERFVMDYLTYQQGEEYTAKMAPYCASGLAFESPSNRSQVTYVGTSKVDVHKGQINVDVLCKVAYATQGDAYDVIQYATLRVPVKIDKDGNCAVVAPPIYVGNSNNPTKIEYVVNSISPTNEDKEDSINTTVKNFLEVYYKGTPSELKYYVTKNYGTPAVSGLGAKIEQLRTNVAAKGDKWDVECQIKINNHGVSQSQHCFLEVVKGAEGRFYINKLYTIN